MSRTRLTTSPSGNPARSTTTSASTVSRFSSVQFKSILSIPRGAHTASVPRLSSCPCVCVWGGGGEGSGQKKIRSSRLKTVGFGEWGSFCKAQSRSNYSSLCFACFREMCSFSVCPLGIISLIFAEYSSKNKTNDKNKNNKPESSVRHE